MVLWRLGRQSLAVVLATAMVALPAGAVPPPAVPAPAAGTPLIRQADGRWVAADAVYPQRPPIAMAAASAVVPGLGEMLTGDLATAGLFFAGRVALMTASLVLPALFPGDGTVRNVGLGLAGASLVAAGLDVWLAHDGAVRGNALADKAIAQAKADGRWMLAQPPAAVAAVPAAQPAKPAPPVAPANPSPPPAASLPPLAAVTAPAVAGIDVDAVPLRTVTSHQNVAVVIGVERYNSRIPGVPYAARDAEAVSKYLTHYMGYAPENVIRLTNEEATRSALAKAFAPGGQVANYLTPGASVLVYFAGHGVPDLNNRQPYLMPYDGDPNYAAITGYGLQDLYNHLAMLPARQVTVILDSCFSGVAARTDDAMLVAGARPLMIRAEGVVVPAKVSVLAASSGTQLSSSLPNLQHGLFTYTLLYGMRGGADLNRDGVITTRELHAYTLDWVRRQARRMNREQTPTIQGGDQAILQGPFK